MEIISKNSQETYELGKQLGEKSKGGVYCLYGDLGAGKTTFVSGFAKGVGYQGRTQSPTFVLMRHYGKIYHIDLYRLSNTEEIKLLGIEEIWSDPSNILLIEWPEKLMPILPENRVDIYFEYVDEMTRKISIKKKDDWNGE